MATVVLSLNALDQMTRALQKLDRALNSTVVNIDRLVNAANQNMNMTKSLNTITTAAQRANTQLQQLGNTENRVVNAANQNMNMGKSLNTITTAAQRANTQLQQLGNTENRVVNAGNQNMNMTKSLNAITAVAQRAKVQLGNAQNSAVNAQNKSSGASNGEAGESGGLLSKVKGFVADNLGFDNIKQGIKSTIGGAMELQQQLVVLQGIMGNKDVATAYFNSLQKKANESGFGFEDLAANARKFMQVTKNTNSLDKLSNLSERLTLMDPSQGLQGAGSALSEMMGGDGASLKGKFGFGNADIEILKATRSMDDFISKFDTLLNKKGFTESALKQFNQSPTAQFDNLQSNIKTGLAQSGNGALEILTPVMTRLNNAFSNGSFQGFFNNLGIGLSMIVKIGLGIADVFMKIANIVGSNWGIIGPIIFGVIAALIAYNATMGIAWLTTIMDVGSKILHAIASWLETAAIFALILAQDGLNAALDACPLSWIIIGIIILIAVFYAAVGAVNHFAGTSISATGIIAGAFMALLAFIANQFITVINLIIDCVAIIWNAIAAFAEFFANVFNDPIGSIVRLFADMADIVLSILEGIASAIDTLFGSKLSKTVSGWRSGLKGLVKDSFGEAEIKVPRMDSNSMHLNRVNYGEAYNSGYKFGKNIEDKFSFKMPDINQNNGVKDYDKLFKDWNAKQGPGELPMNGLDDGSKGHLKNIDDKVDISNEHLEMLRDLAEMESIQNFVTLTPTVQVTTGDIREETDINKIIYKIESYMENQLVSSAEGVYA